MDRQVRLTKYGAKTALYTELGGLNEIEEIWVVVYCFLGARVDRRFVTAIFASHRPKAIRINADARSVTPSRPRNS